MENLVARPTIRIEIQNDIVNEMDVDETEIDGNGEIEDGEVSGVDDDGIDGTENQTFGPILPKKSDILSRLDTVAPVNPSVGNGNKWWNKDGGFSTGVDIFSQEEQSKLNVRAQRFGIEAAESKAITEEQMQELYDSLSISKDVEKMIRFDALHMRGVEEMSTKDIFGYFSAYGPSSIEWVNDYSCNVLWLDNVTASRALHGLSKKINGFELLDEENPFVETDKPKPEDEPKPDSTKGRSILLINKDDPQPDETSQEQPENIFESDKPVDLIDITVPIPPGFWRFGKPHSKAKTILFRFAFKTDRKPFKAEKLSEYYKKHGNPNFGGLKGLISQTRKRQMKFGGNREVRLTNKDFEDENGDSKNPWGNLAQSWSNEDQGIAFNEPKEIVLPVPTNIVKEKRFVLTSSGNSIQDRIGVKRKRSSDEDDENEEQPEVAKKRMKMPRMRMYADEEQDRLNRLKAIKKIATVTKKIEDTIVDSQPDLRARLTQSSDRRRLLQQSKPAQTLLPDLTIRIPQTTVPERKLNRFENRLGEKVVKVDDDLVEEKEYKNGKGKRESVRHRLQERVSHHSDDEELRSHINPADSRQRSTVQVIVRNKPKQPVVASTVSRSHTSNNRRYESTRRNDRDRERHRDNHRDRIDRDEKSRSWRLSDREQFRSSRNYSEHSRSKRSDLRNKITESKPSSRSRPHTSKSTLFRKIKKESSSGSSSSSESESSSSSESSSTSSEKSSSSATSEDKKSKKHQSILRKKGNVVSERGTFQKGESKIVNDASKDSLRIEVQNDNYKKT